MNGFGVGVLLMRERLRSLSVPLVLLLSLAAVFAVGVLERRRDSASAADNTLSGAAFGIALPLLAYLLLERACAGEQLGRSVDGVARYGTNRRAAVLGLLLSSALCMALASALLTTAALLGAHAPGSTAFGRDLRTSIAVGLISGEVYALWFGAASLLGKRGGGRKWALVLDFMLGPGGSLLAAPWPRGHVRNLLGGLPVLDLPQSGAWIALAGIGVASLALSVVCSTE